MKTLTKYSYILLGGVMAFSACKPDLTSNKPLTAGDADFTRYIAVGNSLTAGYADGGLYLAGQKNSYPSIIAAQMAQVGGGPFAQPLFTDAQANGSGYLSLTGFDKTTGSPITTPVTTNLAVIGVSPITTYTKYTGDINNYGVPGIKLIHATIASYGNLNGYYDRMLTTPYGSDNIAYLDFVTAKPYTFFTDWLGNNDALGYATGGGSGVVGGGDALTDKTVFTTAYTASIAKLIANGAKGAVATIPDVSTIPYFTTVTYAALLAGVQKSAPTVTALYISAAAAYPAPIAPVTFPTTLYAARAATASDLFVLTFPTSLIGSTTAGAGTYPYGLDPRNPIESKYVLDVNEINTTKDYVNSYNATIRSVAFANHLAIFDAYDFLNNLKAYGMTVNGVSLSSNFISGGVFSLDGVHLTPRGYAIVANGYISAINAVYHSTIPLADVSSYPGVKFP